MTTIKILKLIIRLIIVIAITTVTMYVTYTAQNLIQETVQLAVNTSNMLEIETSMGFKIGLNVGPKENHGFIDALIETDVIIKARTIPRNHIQEYFYPPGGLPIYPNSILTEI